MTAAGLLFVLAACDQVVYTGLTEVEANQMLAELISHGVPANKTSTGKEGFSISVDSGDMLKALAVLKDAGFPRNTRDSLGKVFQKSGIMSSPFEEHVRYIYALGEELAQTISHIDGVITARVHIVLPDAPQLGQPVKPSSAAVFIKYQPGIDIELFVPQIRRLVSSSVEGLEYSAVTVVLDEAIPAKETPATAKTDLVSVLPGLSIKSADVPMFWRLFYGAIAVIVLVIVAAGAGVYFVLRQKRQKATGLAPSPTVEPT